MAGGARRADAHPISGDQVIFYGYAGSGGRDPVRGTGDGVPKYQQVTGAIHLQPIRVPFERIELDDIVIVAAASAFDSLRIRHVGPTAELEHRVELVGCEGGSARAFHAVAGLVHGVVFDQVASAQASGRSARRCPIVAGHKDSGRTRCVMNRIVMDVVVVAAEQHHSDAEVGDLEVGNFDVSAIDDSQSRLLQ